MMRYNQVNGFISMHSILLLPIGDTEVPYSMNNVKVEGEENNNNNNKKWFKQIILLPNPSLKRLKEGQHVNTLYC